MFGDESDRVSRKEGKKTVVQRVKLVHAWGIARLPGVITSL
jgi:hypothetical protein